MDQESVSTTKSPLSMISSTSSVLSTLSSEGLVMVTSEPGSSASSPPEMVERKTTCTSSSYTSSTDSEGGDSSSSRNSSEEVESVDGLILMGSTRLRPAPEASKDSISKAKLYIQTYRSMFVRLDCTPVILPLALHGNLQNNPFRSVCWRVLLNVLPNSSVDWVTALQAMRSNYQFLQNKFHTDRKMKDASMDLAINNPLSQAEDSPWNQHFQDGELRKMIKQDVVRTFPEVDFFQSHVVRDTLVNILFVFARCRPEIGYRQGMHELLAPLYFVVKSDCDTFSAMVAAGLDNGSDEAKTVTTEMTRTIHRDIFSGKFCEADTFSLFEALMDAVGPWFISTQSVHSMGAGYQGKPWSRPQDQTTGNKLVDNLNYIQDVLLKRHDPTLFSRLEKLEIFPQIYGIRWLRLLFGREFVFRDTLLLWDAIFADSCPPSLCDQLVVSLLMSVRDLLIRYEYQDAVQLLMKLPSNLSVTYCTQFALHLKDPLRFPKPSGSAFARGFIETGKEKKKIYKTENKFRKISAPKIFGKSQPDAAKAPFELVKPQNSFTVEVENGSDFTVLNMKKDSELVEDDSVVPSKLLGEVSGVEPNANVPVTVISEQIESNEVISIDHKCNSNRIKDMNIGGIEELSYCDVRDNEILSVKTNLENAVARLDSLLSEETLLKRNEILQSLGKMKALLKKLPEDRVIPSRKVVSRVGERTASVAVDVATYFEEE